MIRVRYHVSQPYTTGKISKLLRTTNEGEAVFLTDPAGVEHELVLQIRTSILETSCQYYFTPVHCVGVTIDAYRDDSTYRAKIQHLRQGGSGIAVMTFDEMVEAIVSMNFSVA